MSTPEPGWYADPSPAAPPQSLRWWDGTQWTGHVRGGAVAAPVRPGPTTPDGRRLSGWWWRVLALVVDTVVIGIPTFILSLPVQVDLQRQLLDQQGEMQRRIEQGQPFTLDDAYGPVLDAYGDHVVTFLVIPILLALTYHVGFLRWRGATPGKLLCGLRVQPRTGGDRATTVAVLVRVLVMFAPSWAALSIGIAAGTAAAFLLAELAVFVFFAVDVLVALGQRRQAVHDRVAGTIVVTTR